MSFDQFEFHPCNMYFKVGRSFREPQCRSLFRFLRAPVRSVRPAWQLWDLESRQTPRRNSEQG